MSALHDLRLALIQARVVTLGLLVHTSELVPGYWSAHDDRSYGGEGYPLGTGRDEQAAIIDLLEQVEERQ